MAPGYFGMVPASLLAPLPGKVLKAWVQRLLTAVGVVVEQVVSELAPAEFANETVGTLTGSAAESGRIDRCEHLPRRQLPEMQVR